MRKILALSLCLLCAIVSMAQTDHRDVIAVSLKSSDDAKRWAPVVYNSVVEMLIKSHRFRVIDTENKDAIEKEMKRQSGEEFMYADQKSLADWSKALAAKYTLTVKVDKVPVYAFKTNGNTSGYKCAVAFQLILTEVESGDSHESESFQGKTSKEMLSAQAAVVEATSSVAPLVAAYLRSNFPLECKIVKILTAKGGDAKTVLLDIGSKQGIKVGDEFKVEYVEMLGGKPFPTELGVAKVKALKGEDFVEAEISGKDAGKEVASRFAANQDIRCVQIIKKK